MPITHAPAGTPQGGQFTSSVATATANSQPEHGRPMKLVQGAFMSQGTPQPPSAHTLMMQTALQTAGHAITLRDIHATNPQSHDIARTRHLREFAQAASNRDAKEMQRTFRNLHPNDQQYPAFRHVRAALGVKSKARRAI